ncbi:hypothetical protein Vretifemale_15977, partial [Volvox reticuliferus]
VDLGGGAPTAKHIPAGTAATTKIVTSITPANNTANASNPTFTKQHQHQQHQHQQAEGILNAEGLPEAAGAALGSAAAAGAKTTQLGKLFSQEKVDKEEEDDGEEDEEEDEEEDKEEQDMGEDEEEEEEDEEEKEEEEAFQEVYKYPKSTMEASAAFNAALSDSNINRRSEYW